MLVNVKVKRNMMKIRFKFIWLLFIVVGMSSVLPAEELSAFERFRMVRQLEQEANDYLAESKFKKAAKTFLKAFEMENHRDRQAQFILKAADAFYKAEKGNLALEYYKKLLEDYSLYVPYEHVVDQLRGLAEHFVKGEMTFLGLKDVGAAIKIYELIVREAPATHISRKDRFRLAELLQKDDRPDEAVAVYQAIVKLDSRDWDARAELALVLGKLAKISDGDGAKTRAATREAKLVLSYMPDHEKAKDLLKLIANASDMNAQRLLEQAEFYLIPAHRRPPAARRYLHDVISKYPDTVQATKARELLSTRPELIKLEQEAREQKQPKAPKDAVVPPPREFEKPSPQTPPAPVKLTPSVPKSTPAPVKPTPSAPKSTPAPEKPAPTGPKVLPVPAKSTPSAPKSTSAPQKPAPTGPKATPAHVQQSPTTPKTSPSSPKTPPTASKTNSLQNTPAPQKPLPTAPQANPSSPKKIQTPAPSSPAPEKKTAPSSPAPAKKEGSTKESKNKPAFSAQPVHDSKQPVFSTTSPIKNGKPVFNAPKAAEKDKPALAPKASPSGKGSFSTGALEKPAKKAEFHK